MEDKTFKFCGFEIGEDKPVRTIAEIGLNHNGSMEAAKALIDVAVDAGCDVVKFQKRTLSKLYQKHLWDNPNSGEQSFQYFLPILEDFDLNEEQIKELFEYTKEKGIKFLCTPFDIPSVDFLDKLGVEAFKVASCDLVNFPLLERLAMTRKPLLLSTAMTTQAEIDKTVEFLKSKNVEFMLLQCTGSYPAPPEDINLRFIPILRERYGLPVGFSGHERGIYPSLGAVAMGAKIIERHITLDRGQEGPDHLASLEPEQLKELVTGVREIELALGSPAKLASHGELINKKLLRKSLVATTDIKKGDVISKSMIDVKGPAKGLSPQKFYELIGKTAIRDIAEDDFFKEEDLGAEKFVPGEYKFEAPWGLKCRFSEIDFAEQFKPDFLEFHFTDKDLQDPFIPKKKYDFELFIHAPDYWYRGMKDLGSTDPETRKKSIEIAQKTIDKAKELAPYFKGTPKIVMHVGGMSKDKFDGDPKILLDNAIESYKQLDHEGVILLPENLPPRAWYFSGQWFNNTFLDADDMIRFCNETGHRMCLDLAHAYLYCNSVGKDYYEYLEKVAPYVDHLHVADAAGISYEALWVGDGEIDFKRAFDILNKHKWYWTAEIWEGHLNNYEGFFVSMERLRPYIK